MNDTNEMNVHTCRAFAGDISETHMYADKMRLVAANKGHSLRQGRGHTGPRINFQIALRCRLLDLTPAEAVEYFEKVICKGVI